jgi:tetratricopeptide (TPR) repeat protein
LAIDICHHLSTLYKIHLFLIRWIPGSVLVSKGTHRLVKEYFEFHSLGQMDVKGKEEPQEGFELIRAGEVDTRIGASVAKGLRLSTYYAYRGDPLQGVKYSEEAFEVARKSQDVDVIVPIANGLCTSYGAMGQWYKIVDIAPDVIDLLEKTERQSDFFAGSANPYSSLCGMCGTSMGFLGNFSEGKILLEKGQRHAAQIGDLRSLASVEGDYGIFFHAKGEWRPAAEHLQNCIKYSEEVKYLALLAFSWAHLGDAYSYLGDPETGRRCVEKGLEIQREAGFEWLSSLYPFFLGDICLHQGDLKNARSFMEEALRLSQKNNDKNMEGVSWILLGAILGRTETLQFDKAEGYILKGIKIYDELKEKTYYARGYFSLGELYANAGLKEKANPFIDKWNPDLLGNTLASEGFSEDGKEQLYIIEEKVERPLRYRTLVGPQYFLRLHHLAEEKSQARSIGRPYDYTLRDNQPRVGKRLRGGQVLGSGQRAGEMESWALAAHGAWNLLDDLFNVKSDDRRLLEKIDDADFEWDGSRRSQAFANLILVFRSLALDL